MTHTTKEFKYFFLLSPLFVLLVTRGVVEMSTRLFDHEVAWVPAFLGYYLAILIVGYLALTRYSVNMFAKTSLRLAKVPTLKLLLLGIVIPALLPVSVFIAYIDKIPIEFIFYILFFSLINPVFEEGFWRGLMVHQPMNKLFVTLYTALLFSFSHYFLWGTWLSDYLVLLPTLISTFLMGLAWMWFIQKTGNLSWLIISHFFVDVFNLSVAVYYGLVPQH